MAKREEDIILNLEIEQKDALSELDRLKKSIIGIKQEQDELKKAYKAGAITLDEFAKGSVRLEGLLKAQTSAYNNLQKSATGVKTQLDKLIDSNKQLSNTTRDAINNTRIHGVSVGDLTTKMAGLLNPVTAAVSVTGALLSVYARSTIGAKDFEFAQNQLNTAITIGANAFAELFSSAEDGEGFFSKLTSAVLFAIDPTTSAIAKLAALNQEKLEDLQRDELVARDEANKRLETNQELLTEIQSDQTKLNDKLLKADEIITNLRRNEEALKTIFEDELSILNDQLKIDSNNESIQTSVLQKKLQIANLERDTEKRVQNIVKLTDNLVDAEAKRIKQAQEAKEKEDQKKVDAAVKSFKPIDPHEEIQKEKERQELFLQTTQEMGGKRIELENQTEEQIAKNKAFWAKKSTDAQMAADEVRFQSAAMIAGALANLAKEGSTMQRTTALLAIAADTAAALVGGIRAAQSVPFPGNIFAMATTTATILGNIAAAKKLFDGKAAGGGHFYTKGPALLMVGDNPGGVERVSVEPISGKGQTKLHPNSNLVAMAGGGTISPASMAATRALTNPINMRFRGGQQKLNLKVSWAEGKEMDRAVAFKERLTTL